MCGIAGLVHWGNKEILELVRLYVLLAGLGLEVTKILDEVVHDLADTAYFSPKREAAQHCTDRAADPRDDRGRSTRDLER